AVIGRAAATAVVEAEDAALLGVAIGEVGEIRAVAGEAGEADERQSRRQRIAIVAVIKREPVLRGEPPVAKGCHAQRPSKAGKPSSARSSAVGSPGSRSRGAPPRLAHTALKPKCAAPAASQPLDEMKQMCSASRSRRRTISS